jgi:hypothetical protein
MAAEAEAQELCCMLINSIIAMLAIVMRRIWAIRKMLSPDDSPNLSITDIWHRMQREIASLLSGLTLVDASATPTSASAIGR